MQKTAQKILGLLAKPFKYRRINENKPSRDTLSGLFRAKYERFKELLDSNSELAEIMADMEGKLQGNGIFGLSWIRSHSARAVFHALRMVQSLNALSGDAYPGLLPVVEKINNEIKTILETRHDRRSVPWVLPWSAIDRSMTDWVGGKSANLGEILNGAHLPIPEGFAVTTGAYDYFLTRNELLDEIDKRKMEIDVGDPESIDAVSQEIQRLIITAPMPDDLAQAILSAYDTVVAEWSVQNPGAPPPAFSMRSSAIGEDSELSFAGQYLSMLNVTRDRLVQTYSFIIASLFTPRAISYRLNKGILVEDIAMSVACLRMVDSTASGVVYSRHPFDPNDDAILITGVWGLGPYAVDGVVTPDTFKVTRNAPRTIGESVVSNKSVRLVCNPDGGLMELPVQEELREAPCISSRQVELLADYAMKLEAHYGRPQDIEWALDETGRIILLQTRPLHVESAPLRKTVTTELLHPYRILIEGGSAAAPGAGFGPVFHVHSEDDLFRFPEGGVLVAKHSSPKFVLVMPRASAIVTDTGSVTGHMASLCREFQVPTLLGVPSAIATLPEGVEITVDAFSQHIYEGKVEELLNVEIKRDPRILDTPVYRTLQTIAAHILPLRLVDPKSPDFTPEHCSTLHDVMRFVHENSYAQMFQLSDMASEKQGCAVKLIAPIPLDLHIIDIGGGLDADSEHCTKINVDKVTSVPFNALLRGLLHEDLRYHRPRPVELGGFLSVMGQQMLTPAYGGAERFGDRSYAVVSDKYLNFSSRVGYHYGVLDAYCGKTINNNYITFSFKGGAADDIRRNRRARAIAVILHELDFTVNVTADRVDSRFQKYDCPTIQDKLDQLGRLLQFTRQMDMLMKNEAAVERIARCFLDGNYNLD